jgi:hypothetical protein
LIKPTNDMAMPAELLMASLFKSKFSYFWKYSLLFQLRRTQ